MINDATFAANIEQRQLLELARAEIMQLRQWYGVATDCIGQVDDPEAQARGLAIYQRIFTPDAQMSVRGSPLKRAGQGPAGWADVAREALRDYQATQHLIGTQVVSFSSVQFGAAPVSLEAGRAAMESYVQAWHAWPDRQLRLVLGTYEDTVQWVPGTGWQIDHMVLDIRSGEHRQLGTPP
ncbi:MAG: nuclear transport factor 2 family protein [Pseudomonadales bacterium]